MVEEMGSGNKLQRQKKGPFELRREKGKASGWGEDEG